MNKNHLSDLEKMFNDEAFNKNILTILSEEAQINEFIKEESTNTAPNGYWVQCYSDTKKLHKFWFELITYMLSSYEHIVIDVYDWDIDTINRIKNIGWNYKFENEYEIVSFSGVLSEKIKSFVATNVLNSNMQLIWFCVKLIKKDMDEILMILPAHSMGEEITVTIHMVSEEQLGFLKSLVGEDISATLNVI